MEGSIEGSRHDSRGLGGGTVASKRNSGRLGGSIEGFGPVHAIARFLGGTLGSNCYKAFRLALALSCTVQQVAQVGNILLLKLAEGSLKKEERGRFWMQEEQYLASIPDIKSSVYKCKCI